MRLPGPLPIRRLVAVIGLLTTLAPVVLLGAAPTLASCVMPPPLGQSLNEASMVFVGRVTETREMDRWAVVSVEEVWKGPDLPPSVLIKGGEAGDMFTSVDRTYRTGVRYLFVPSGDPATGIAESACSPTTEWTDDLAAMRPASVRTPTAGPAQEDTGDLVSGLVMPVIVVVVVSVVLLGIGLLARGRRET